MKHIVQALRPIPRSVFHELASLEFKGERFHLALWRILSVVMAVTVAALLQLDDLSWAAFSGFMVMRSEVNVSILRGFNRFFGTFAGIFIGLLGAALSADHPWLMVALFFFVGWVCSIYTFFSPFSYAWLFFYLTITMVMGYSLTDPAGTFGFAETRLAEISIGTGSCVLVAALRAGALPARVKRQSTVGRHFHLSFVLSEAWLERYWLLVGYSARVGIACAIQPLIANFINVDNNNDLTQQMTSAFVVMMMGSNRVYEGDHVYVHTRIVHRMVGCILGSLFGILLLSLFEQTYWVLVMGLAVGVMIASQVEHGEHRIPYVGTQFGLGFLMTYVQSYLPATSITPGLDRLVGIIAGCVGAYIVLQCWPLGLSVLKYRARHTHHHP